MSSSPPQAKWVIVTGASSGIGRALAREFASGSFNVLLTGRDEAALNKVAQECSSSFRVMTKVVVADLAQSESVDRLISAIATSDDESRQYEVLVNNAGFSVHGDFARTDIDKEVELVNVQLLAALRLTKAVLPGMISRRRGCILNVASVYSYAPVPFQSIYAACKAFLLSFSASLRNELGGTGVTVTAFCPGITQTEIRVRAGIADSHRNSGMTAEAAAHAAYVAALKGKAVAIPRVENQLFVFLAKILPNSTFTGVIRFINKMRGHKR